MYTLKEFPRPVYVGTRTFLGLKDLVVSFYAQKCQFKCTYCNLPTNSHPEPLSVNKIKQQVDWLFENYQDSLHTFQQLSVGNEGSILDPQRFSEEAFDYLLDRAKDLTALQVLSLETRPEYISATRMERILSRTQADLVDVTVGFETQDNHLRQVILQKSIRRKTFENRIKLLGELGIRLTSYVLLKPGPSMTEAEGVQEAVATVEYLAEICQRFNTALVIYLNPVYAAKGTPLAEAFLLNQYQPPRIQSVVEVIAATKYLNLPVYTGLWAEDNEIVGGNYTYHANYQPEIRSAIFQYNKTQDFGLLMPYIPDRVSTMMPHKA